MDAKVKNLLRKCYLFEKATDEAIEAFSAEAKRMDFSDGDPVFLTSELSHHVYFVESGSVNIVAGQRSSEGTVVSVIKEGQYLSELSVLVNSRHSVSAFAKGDTRLVAIEGHQFVGVLQTYPDIARDFSQALGKRVVGALLDSFSVRPLNDEGITFHPLMTQIFPAGMIKKFNVVPIRIIEKSLHVAIVLPFDKTFFEAFEKLNNGYKLLISTIEFPQLEPLQQEFLSYYSGLKSAEKERVEPVPNTQAELKEFLQFSLAFSQLPETILDQIIPYFTREEYKVGENVFSEGSEAKQLRLIASGRVDLVKEVPGQPMVVHVESAGPGDSLGDIAMASQENSPCSAYVLENTEIFSLPAEVVTQLMQTVDFTLPLSMSFCHRLQALNRLPGLDLDLSSKKSNSDFSDLKTLDQAKEQKGPKLEKIQVENPEKILEAILLKSVELEASDIHFEFGEEEMIVRCRIDGVMVQLWEGIPVAQGHTVVNKLKVLSELDISEKRLPQDGQLEIEGGRIKVSGRVSTVPTRFGEKAVVRILRKQSAILPLNRIAPDRDVIKFLNHVIRYRQGLFLVAGPTGSGKTTTLYSLLGELVKRDYNIVTIEDPVEMEIPGVNQIQLNTGIGLNSKVILKSVLRQDPDVILVGEIRDAESLQLVFEASMTGHLVLATIHAPNTIDIVHRLIELGASPAQMASSLIGVISQRLVRRVCEGCKTTRSITSAEVKVLKRAVDAANVPHELIEGSGCDACNQSGFLRRIPVFEFWRKTPKVADCLMQRKDMTVLKEVLEQDNFISLGDYGLRMVANGLTTLDEVENTIFGLCSYDSDEDAA